MSLQMFFPFTTERPCLQRWVWQSVKMEALWGSSLLKRYKRHETQAHTLMEKGCVTFPMGGDADPSTVTSSVSYDVCFFEHPPCR